MDNEQKEKAKKVGKILGSAAWSATKGIVKKSYHMAQAGVTMGTNGAERDMVRQSREAGKANNDFKNAFNKLKSLKNLDEPIPEEQPINQEEWYDPRLDEPTSIEYNYFSRDDGSEERCLDK